MILYSTKLYCHCIDRILKATQTFVLNGQACFVMLTCEHALDLNFEITISLRSFQNQCSDEMVVDYNIDTP